MTQAIDVFNGDFYSTVDLTVALTHMPTKPGLIRSMNLFQEEGIYTDTAIVEEKSGHLRILKTEPRGTRRQYQQTERSKGRPFIVPHIPYDDTVLASDIMGKRDFGANGMADPQETYQSAVTKKLNRMKDSHDATHEIQMLGAVKGQVVDPDGETVYDWFDEFGITKKVLQYDTNLRQTARELKRWIKDNHGEGQMGSIFTCVVGSEFMDKIEQDPMTQDAFHRYQDSSHLRVDNNAYEAFEYAGVYWVEYPGGPSGNDRYVTPNLGHAFPMGTDRFQRRNAPAETVSAWGTQGMPYYASQEPLDHGKGVEIHTESNPLFVMTQPNLLVEIEAV